MVRNTYVHTLLNILWKQTVADQSPQEDQVSSDSNRDRVFLTEFIDQSNSFSHPDTLLP